MDTPDLPTPEVIPPSTRRSALLGAVLGITALVGTIVGVSAIAAAQDDPAPDSTIEPAADSDEEHDEDGDGDSHDASELFDIDFEAYEACMVEQIGDLWFEPDVDLSDEGDFEEELPFDQADEQRFVDAEALCEELLPEEIQQEIEAWRPYEECVDDNIGDLPDPWEHGEEVREEDWAAHDAAWEAADEACRELLPAEVQQEMAAWDEFDDCLRDAGVFDDDFEGGSAVHIETGDGFQIAEFGEVDGSVTITGTDGDLTVTATGGVTLLDEAELDAQWEAFDAAHAACEDVLPQDLLEEFNFDDFDEFDETDEFYEDDED